MLKALYLGTSSTFEELFRPGLAPGSSWCLVCSICIYYCLPTFMGALSFWWMSFCFDSTINAAPPADAAPASSGECFFRFIGRLSFSSFFPLTAFALSGRTGLNNIFSGLAFDLSITAAFSVDELSSYRLSSPARPRSSLSQFGYFGATGLSIASV